MVDIISGERVQSLCNIYLGYQDDFNYNPEITKQKEKHLNINDIPTIWMNPSIIFCYSHKIIDLSKKINSIQNPCIIIFGNSDQNISEDICAVFLESNLVKHIYCQNISFNHSKASFLPIGIANRQWPHGNPRYIEQLYKNTILENKLDGIFCNFSISTNAKIRSLCLESMNNNGIKFCHGFSQEQYINTLAKYKYSICPEGNGLDTHRFWESLWVQTIPIVTRSPLTEQIKASGIPCIIIDSWAEFNTINLNEYSSFVFDDAYYYSLSLSKLRTELFEKISSF